MNKEEGLGKIARQIRVDVVETLSTSTGGHYGGALSAAELLSALYFDVLRVNPERPSDPERDRFVLGKGHISVAYCSALARRGFFPIEEVRERYNKLGSPFAMHPDMTLIPGCDMSTGSLGHGLPVAVGMALAGRLDGKDYRVFVMVGDADLQEGSTWEAANAAAAFGLDNLVCIVDRNMITMDGFTEKLVPLEPAADKWRAFNWAVREIDGHDLKEIRGALHDIPFQKGHPSLLMAHTVKGKGISFLENRHESHFVKFTAEDTEKALNQLNST